MCDNASSNNPVSLIKFLEEKIVIIPFLQRDYAQGRDNKETEVIRTMFVDAICNSIIKNEPLSLDFTYGEKKSDEKRYYPVDGQQRLMTLFLVCAWFYRNIKSDKNSKEKRDGLYNALMNFHFEARHEASDYLKALLDDSVSDSSLISPEIWYRSPSAECMARTYALINEKLSNREVETGNLIDNLNNITFFEISGDLPSDVFIKMNARGRKLSESEIFKAAVIKEFPSENQDKIFSSAYSAFFEKLFDEYKDADKTDKDADKTDKDADKTDKALMRIIKSWFYFLESQKKDGKEAQKEKPEKLNWLSDYIPFQEYKNIIKTEPVTISALVNFFDFCISEKEQKVDDIVGKVLPVRDRKELLELSPDILSALVVFFINGNTKILDDLKKWMRFACNIIDNTDISDIRSGLLKEIANADDFYSYILNFDCSKLKNASALQVQMEEEKEKIAAVKNKKISVEKIEEAENFSFAYGAIRYLYKIYKNENGENQWEIQWENFEKKFLKFKDLFEVKADNLCNIPKEVISKFVWGVDQGDIQEKFIYSMKIGKDFVWREIFLLNGAKFAEITDAILMEKDVNTLKLKDDNISLHKQLIAMIDNCCNNDETIVRYRWYHRNKCYYPFLYPRNSSGSDWYLLDGARLKDDSDKACHLCLNNQLYAALVNKDGVRPCCWKWRPETKSYTLEEVQLIVKDSGFVTQYRNSEGKIEGYKGDKFYFSYYGKFYALAIRYDEYGSYISRIPIGENGNVDLSDEAIWKGHEPVYIDCCVDVQSNDGKYDEDGIVDAVKKKADEIIKKLSTEQGL